MIENKSNWKIYRVRYCTYERLNPSGWMYLLEMTRSVMGPTTVVA